MARPINALVIDDSGTTRSLVMRALDQTGLAKFTFTQAGDGVEAMDKFNPGETEIIFADMNMPRMDGLTFVRELHNRHRKCPPVVIVTGETSTEKLQEALATSGVAAFMLKPVDRDRLRSGLKKLIDSIPERGGRCPVPHGDSVTVALLEIMRQVCGAELAVTARDEKVTSGRILQGMIAIHGAVEWTVVIGFAEEAAFAAAARFIGGEGKLGEDDVADAVAELTNMVGGKIKSALAAKGLDVNMSLPTVLGASNLRLLIHRKTTSNETHFDSPLGRLWTSVAVGSQTGMLL